jgi:hypothetical protein
MQRRNSAKVRTGALFLAPRLLMGGPEQVVWRRLLLERNDCYFGCAGGMVSMLVHLVRTVTVPGGVDHGQYFAL